MELFIISDEEYDYLFDQIIDFEEYDYLFDQKDKDDMLGSRKRKRTYDSSMEKLKKRKDDYVDKLKENNENIDEIINEAYDIHGVTKSEFRLYIAIIGKRHKKKAIMEKLNEINNAHSRISNMQPREIKRIFDDVGIANMIISDLDGYKGFFSKYQMNIDKNILHCISDENHLDIDDINIIRFLESIYTIEEINISEEFAILLEKYRFNVAKIDHTEKMIRGMCKEISDLEKS